MKLITRTFVTSLFIVQDLCPRDRLESRRTCPGTVGEDPEDIQESLGSRLGQFHPEHCQLASVQTRHERKVIGPKNKTDR